MSRTYRLQANNWIYSYKSAMRNHDTDAITPPQLDPKSKEGKKRIAYHRADHYKRFKEPGPHWYRNLFTERPQRREAKHQLHCYVRDPNTVVILNAKDPLDYWT